MFYDYTIPLCHASKSLTTHNVGNDGSAKRPVIIAPLTGESPASGNPGPAAEGGAGEGGGP